MALMAINPLYVMSYKIHFQHTYVTADVLMLAKV